MAVLVFGLGRVLVQLVDQVERLGGRQALDAFHASGVEIQRGAATDRMPDHQGLEGLRNTGLLLGRQFGHGARAVAAFIDVGRAQRQHLVLHGLRQIVKGGAHIDKLGVAAVAGQGHRVQRRGLRRCGKVGVIGVVVLAAHMQLAIDHRQVAAGDGAHLRMVRQGELFELLLHQLAEHAGGSGKLGRSQVLVTDHEDGILDPGLVERVPGVRVGQGGQVNAGDFRAKNFAQGLEGELHVLSHLCRSFARKTGISRQMGLA